MSIKGSSYARFRRALELEQPLLIRAAAAELPSLTLADALRVALVLARREPETFPRAAARWVGRLAREVRGLSAGELIIASGALAALGEGRVQPGADALAAVLAAHGLADVERALDEAVRR